MPGSFQIELCDTYDTALLAAEWHTLEKQACASFFLSWSWISAWLESVPGRPVLVRVRLDSATVALGLLSRATIRRHVFVRSRQLHLHQAGNEDLDRIATEFNGFLIRQDMAEDVVTEILRGLQDLLPSWDECVLPGVPSCYATWSERAGYVYTMDRRSPNFIVNLDRLREQDVDLTQTLSRNSRTQLRRALRLAGAEGTLTICPAADLKEALSYFEALKGLDRWKSKGQSGAFASVARDLFHRKLISRAFPREELDLLCVRAGMNIIGYLYQFSYRGQIMSYQAAYVPGKDNRYRPGIVMHYLAIERAKARGAKTYDFLAGQARYKKSLGEEGEELVWLRLQRTRPAFMLERALGRMWNAV